MSPNKSRAICFFYAIFGLFYFEANFKCRNSYRMLPMSKVIKTFAFEIYYCKDKIPKDIYCFEVHK